MGDAAHARFGELRGLLASEPPVSARALLALCEAAREEAPARYQEAWLPYLRAATPTLMITQEAHLDAALELCPRARLHLHPDARRWRKKGRQRHLTPQAIEAMRKRLADAQVEALVFPDVGLDYTVLGEVVRMIVAAPELHALALSLAAEEGVAVKRACVAINLLCQVLGKRPLQALAVRGLHHWPTHKVAPCATLTSLSLTNATLTAEAWGALAGWLDGGALEALELLDCDADSDALGALLRAASPTTLRALSLCGRHVVIDALPALPALETLALERLDLTPERLSALLDGTPALGALHLTSMHRHDPIEALTTDRLNTLEHLRTLSLSSTSAADQLAQQVASAARLTLDTLRLDRTPLTTEGALALIRAPHLERAMIDMSRTRVDAEALRRDLHERSDPRRLIAQEGDHGARPTLILWPVEAEATTP